MQIRYPDYQDSLLSLMNSISKYYGIEGTDNTLKEVDQALKQGYKNIAIVVLDGMGTKILEENLREESFLRRHFVRTISSVFPPTTTAATTTLQSGLSPMAHGWLGWSLHFDEVDDNINIFINTNDDGKVITDYHVAERYIPYENIIDKIHKTGKAKAYSVSPFGTVCARSLDELCNEVNRISHNGEHNYMYVYWPEPDSTMHMTGCYSEYSRQVLEELDERLESLCAKLQDTLVIVTADHGHIDGRGKVLTDYPDLVNTLKYLPSIEPRAVAFFVKEGMNEAFLEAFNKYFKEDFLLLSREEVIKEKLFGEGVMHPKFQDFLGDYMAIAISDVTLFNTKEDSQKFIGVHAGLTAEEMDIPLIIISC